MNDVWYDSHGLRLSTEDDLTPTREFDQLPIDRAGEGEPLPITAWVTIPDELSSEEEMRIRIRISATDETGTSFLYLDVS